MTVAAARMMLDCPQNHDDGDIREAARTLMQDGTPEDIERARKFINFGQKHSGPPTARG